MAQRILIPLLALFALLIAAAPAQAAFGFEAVGVEFEKQGGGIAEQAGSHPFAMTTRIDMNRILDAEDHEVPDGTLRDLSVELPPGFVGDPGAVPTCPNDLFRTVLIGGYSGCPDESAIGVIRLRLVPGGAGQVFPVFNLEPTPGTAARIGFLGLSVPVTMGVGVKQEMPNNVVSSLVNVPQTTPFYGSDLTLWGNPADPAHDAERGGCLDLGLNSPPPREDCHVDYEPRAFLTLPRNCSEPLKTTFRARSWQVEGAYAEDESPPLSGCGKLGFEAEIHSQPDTASASSPAALDFDVDIDDPGLTDPDENAQSDIKAVTVTLPPGVEINPSQAAALEACTPAQLENEKAATPFGSGCPAGSSVGTVEVETPLLQGRALKGHVFVATPYDNPFHSLLALYMTIADPEKGIGVKLAGKVAPVESGPAAGQITATFEDLPQLPFSHLRFHFRGGERSALSTPARCGTYTTTATFTPSAAPSEPFTATSDFEVTSGPGGSPCPQGDLAFGPSLQAGTAENDAGSFSPLLLRVQRHDGEQPLTRLDTLLPPGLSGRLAGIPPCPDAALAAARGRSGAAELAAPSCPQASRLGSVLAGAGVGPALTYVPGSLYLAGPYEGAPLSIAAITPAVAGPFDLGTVVVRLGVTVDPVSARIHVLGSSSEPIPTFLRGIPLQLRDLRIAADRQDFTINPTSCEPMAIGASLFGSQGALAQPSEPFQARACGRLGFRPALRLELKGSTHRRAHPRLIATLRPRPGDADIAFAQVRLPRAAFLDQGHIRTICTRVQFAAGAGNGAQCPAGSVYGRASASTPLLGYPLAGKVFLRSSDHPLPDLVAAFSGPDYQPIHFELVGRTDAVNNALRNTFESAPDVPVSSFRLELFGGRRGLIELSDSLCRQPRAHLRMRAHNGRLYREAPKVRAACKPRHPAHHSPGKGQVR